METLPDDTPITAEGYREIHRYIFQDVYDWAGKTRTVDLAKNDDLFCLAAYVDQELAKRFEAIRTEGGLRGLSAESFAARAADHISELNAIHPFREGNGRTQRAFLFVLGRQAGHEVDIVRIEPIPAPGSRCCRAAGRLAYRECARLSKPDGAHRRRLSSRTGNRHLRAPDGGMAAAAARSDIHSREPAGAPPMSLPRWWRALQRTVTRFWSFRRTT